MNEPKYLVLTPAGTLAGYVRADIMRVDLAMGKAIGEPAQGVWKLNDTSLTILYERSSEFDAWISPLELSMEIPRSDYNELKSFVRRITLDLQSSRAKTPEDWDIWFNEAYRLYVKHDVEDRRRQFKADAAVPPAVEAIDALGAYGEHKDWCGATEIRSPCTCGLIAAWDVARLAVGEVSEAKVE